MTTTPRRWIAQSIADHANFYGDKIAVRDETAELSYRTLIGRAAGIVEGDRRPTVPDLPIGIFLPNAASYLVAIVALLLAGRTSVPLNTAHPDERNCRIIGRAPLGAAIVDATTAASMHRMAPSLQLIDVAAGAMNAAPPLMAAPVPKADFHDQLHVRHHRSAQGRLHYRAIAERAARLMRRGNYRSDRTTVCRCCNR